VSPARAERIAPERARSLAAAEAAMEGGRYEEAQALLDELASSLAVEEAVLAARLDLALRRAGPVPAGEPLPEPVSAAASALERRGSRGRRGALLLAEVARLEGNAEAEARCCREALAASPGDDRTRLRLAYLELMRGQDVAAAELALEMVPRNPRCPAVLQIAGRALIGMGDGDRAAPVVERLAELRPSDPEAHAMLGTARLLAGRPADAAREFGLAAQLDPTPSRRANLGLMLSLAGRSDEAVAVLQALVEEHPGQLSGWNNLGVALTAAGRLAEALAAFTRALELDPGSDVIRTNIGDLEARILRGGGR
jgi:Flp pilus assembly protein TadD